MLIALVAGKGSPGVTTTALALAMSWPRPALLVELDPTGGDIRVGYGQGVRTDGRGLTMLRDERRANLSSTLWDNVLGIEGFEQRWWLPGVEHPRQARLMDWPKIADLLAESGGLGVDVIADCGCYWTERPPRAVWQAAALVGLVIRPTVPGVAAARNAGEALVADLETGGLGRERLVGVVVGAGSSVGPYPARDVAEALPDLPIAAALDWDRKGADMLAGLAPVRRRPAKLLKQAAGAAENLLTAASPHGGRDAAVAFHTPPAAPVPTPSPVVESPARLVADAPPGPLVDAMAMVAAGRHHPPSSAVVPASPHAAIPAARPLQVPAAPAAPITDPGLLGFPGAVPPAPPPPPRQGEEAS